MKFKEDKQAICEEFCKVLQMTSALGYPEGNPLEELKYMPNGNGKYTEAVRPIFRDGTGSNGYYDINVGMDSGVAVIIDIVNQFVKRM